MVPLAPLTVSTTTVWPSALPMPSARMRASVSVGPPGGNPTSSVIGRDGKLSAYAGSAAASSAMNAPMRLSRFMAFPLVCPKADDDTGAHRLKGQQHCRERADLIAFHLLPRRLTPLCGDGKHHKCLHFSNES